MADQLTNPGDAIEGRGVLLFQGRRIAEVNYHLAVPTQTHFFVNPAGNLRAEYRDAAGGFILLKPADAEQVACTDYLLELDNRRRLSIRVERRYKKITHAGQPRVSFYVTVI